MKFPSGFYWGAATASYQVEGGIENNDWAQAARDGYVPEAGRLADHYHRYEADFDLAKKLGHNAHRISLEWSRIEPADGQFDEAELEHYREVIAALRERGIEPFVTLWHFTLPQWFAESGGFERTDSPDIFARYARMVAEALGSHLTHVSTINEPNVWVGHGWLYGAWPPFKRGSLLFRHLGKDDGSTARVGAEPKVSNTLLYFKVERHLIAAHKAAYTAMKEVRPQLQVSIVKHVRWFTSDRSPINRVKAAVMQYLQSDRYMHRIKHHLDEIGLNYYRVTTFGDRKNYLKTDMDWNAYPSGIYGALATLKKFRKPIFVSEAGVADEDDDLRAQYITLQLQGVARALQEGIDVRGHMYWSLIDNYEWALGTTKRFGLIEIDYDTLERKIRPSAWHYKDLIERYSEDKIA